MHWLLSVPDTFSLREVIRRSGWLLIASLHAKTSGDHLYRVEDLDGAPVKLDVYQAPAGLVIQADPRLSGPEVEEASQKVWRMLRLDENLQPFLRIASQSPGLRSVRRSGARLVRGTTLFEDVITAVLTTWDKKGEPHFGLAATLIDRLGFPLPRNPTLHTFPRPQRVLKHPELLATLFGSELADGLLTVASEFDLHGPQPVPPAQLRGSLPELKDVLSTRFRLTPSSLSLLMLRLGRYDHIPTDEAAVRRLSYAHRDGQEITPHELLTLFSRFQPWGGLAYWLWDWSKVPELLGC